jgi:hypothetical protein
LVYAELNLIEVPTIENRCDLNISFALKLKPHLQNQPAIDWKEGLPQIRR